MTVGFLAERAAVRVGWLPAIPDGNDRLDDSDVVGYEVFRAGPFELSDDVSGQVLAQQSVGQVTATTFDDENIEIAKKYGYAVAYQFPSGATGGMSDYVWIALDERTVLRPQVAAEYADFCSAALESPVTDCVVIQPSDRARPAPLRSGADAGRIAYTLSGIVGATDRVSVQWRAAVVDDPDVTFGIGCAPQSHDLPGNRCTTIAAAPACASTLASLRDDPDAMVYAIVMQAESAYEQGVATISEVYFPLDDADQFIRLDDVTPTPGAVLRDGYHEFKANIHYRVATTAGLQLTAYVWARDALGKEIIVDAKPFPLAAASGEELYATGVTVDAAWRDVRLVARFGRGTPEGVYIQDVVTYGLAP